LFGTDPVGALIEHWDGTAWSIVASPALDQPGAVLLAISVVSPDDIWAVGYQSTPSAGYKPLIEHWNGRAWSIVPAPAPAAGPTAWLEGVSGDSSTDAWAVGYYAGDARTSTAYPLVEHWNGTAWTAVPLPASVSALKAVLVSVYAAAPDDVWATEGLSHPPAVFVHWDGTAWSTVPAPVPDEYGLSYDYESIDGSGPGDVWAAGTVATGYPPAVQYPLIARLSCGPGSRW
jgi:hypothetical protein